MPHLRTSKSRTTNCSLNPLHRPLAKRKSHGPDKSQSIFRSSLSDCGIVQVTCGYSLVTLTKVLSLGQNQLQRLQSPAKHLHESEGPLDVYKIMILVIRAFSNDQSSIGMAPNPSRSGSPGSPPPHLKMNKLK